MGASTVSYTHLDVYKRQLVILPQGDEHVVDVEILAADPDRPLLQLAAVVVPQVLVETVETRHYIPVGADTLDIGVHGTAQLAALGLRDLVVLKGCLASFATSKKASPSRKTSLFSPTKEVG